MAILYVAASKTMQDWGADVGLGKNLFKLGVAEDGTPDEAVAGLAGHTDWKVLKTAEVEFDEAEALARLARKEKLVDANYYPKLRGAQGIVKVNLVAVENSRVIALALDGKEPPKTKAKAADIAAYLVNNAVK